MLLNFRWRTALPIQKRKRGFIDPQRSHSRPTAGREADWTRGNPWLMIGSVIALT